MNKTKYRAITALASKYGVMPMCKILNIKRNSYYKWLKISANTEKDIELYKYIAEIQQKNKTNLRLSKNANSP